MAKKWGRFSADFWSLKLPILPIFFQAQADFRSKGVGNTVALPSVLPGLVIYHQFRDFWRPTGDKFFVQITSDFMVISDIGQNLGNFQPFLVKISDFSRFFYKSFQQTLLEIFCKPFTKFSKKNFTKKFWNIFQIFIFRKFVT